MIEAELVISLAERFGRSPQEVKEWDVETLRMVRIYDHERAADA